jgi:hypothetical protein
MECGGVGVETESIQEVAAVGVLRVGGSMVSIDTGLKMIAVRLSMTSFSSIMRSQRCGVMTASRALPMRNRPASAIVPLWIRTERPTYCPGQSKRLKAGTWKSLATMRSPSNVTTTTQSLVIMGSLSNITTMRSLYLSSVAITTIQSFLVFRRERYTNAIPPFLTSRQNFRSISNERLTYISCLEMMAVMTVF